MSAGHSAAFKWAGNKFDDYAADVENNFVPVPRFRKNLTLFTRRSERPCVR